jgi:integrase
MKKANVLSDILLKSLRDKPTQNGKFRKIYDGNGLYAFITPIGTISFRHDYKLDGKNKTHVIGLYPTISLKEARELHFKAKRDINNGINLTQKKQAKRNRLLDAQINSSPTFTKITEEFITIKQSLRDDAYVKTMQGRINIHILPDLGDKQITEITPSMLLDTLKKVELLGLHETAHKLLTICGQIFRFAIASQKLTIDPTISLRGALAPVPTKHRAALDDPKDIRRLLLAIDDYTGSQVVKSALQLAPLLFVRPGELRHAEWSEIDFESCQWVIPADKMKMRKKHIVPLASQAVEILQSLRSITGGGKYLFPGPRTVTRPISDVTLLNALRVMGFEKHEMTVHGFRAIASTRLNEMGYNYDWIEKQLAHCESNGVRSAYNHALYLKQRQTMIQEWADYLYDLKNHI